MLHPCQPFSRPSAVKHILVILCMLYSRACCGCGGRGGGRGAPWCKYRGRCQWEQEASSYWGTSLLLFFRLKLVFMLYDPLLLTFVGLPEKEHRGVFQEEREGSNGQIHRSLLHDPVLERLSPFMNLHVLTHGQCFCNIQFGAGKCWRCALLHASRPERRPWRHGRYSYNLFPVPSFFLLCIPFTDTGKL